MNISLIDNLNRLNTIYHFSLKNDNFISVSQSLFITVMNILCNLKYQPEVFPTFFGNIQLEYENKNGKYLEIEITSDGNMKIFKINDRKEIESDFIKMDLNIIKKEVELFYE